VVHEGRAGDEVGGEVGREEEVLAAEVVHE
jgi:hypothetical protein